MKRKKGGRKRRHSGRWKSPAAKVKAVMRRADVVIEVLDARNPYGTMCVWVEESVKRAGKVLLFVLNKCDLIPQETSEQLKKDLREIAPTVFTCATKKQGIGKLRDLIRSSAPGLPTKVAMVGYPNVGKSQLCNALKGKSAAKVAPVPGYTKSKQWIKVSRNILLFDTPGVIIRRESETSLALKGAIDADKLKNPEGAAIAILKRVMEGDEEALWQRYGVTGDPEEMLVEIARKRGKLKKGGVPDTVAAAKIVIRDFCKGKIKRQEPKPRPANPDRQV